MKAITSANEERLIDYEDMKRESISHFQRLLKDQHEENEDSVMFMLKEIPSLVSLDDNLALE